MIILDHIFDQHTAMLRSMFYTMLYQIGYLFINSIHNCVKCELSAPSYLDPVVWRHTDTLLHSSTLEAIREFF